MSGEQAVIEINELVRKYGRTEAVNGLSLKVRAGRCYGFFGRNGAGKTTTIKCLLNLLQPTSGSVRVFGLDPRRDEVAVKSRIAYVPDQVAFYPWMTVRDTLDYLASFRKKWNKQRKRLVESLRRNEVFLSPRLNEVDTQKLFQKKAAEQTLIFLSETQIGDLHTKEDEEWLDTWDLQRLDPGGEEEEQLSSSPPPTTASLND